MSRPILVSACLLGLKTRYNGLDAFSKEAQKELAGRIIIPVCPEQLGGLPTPRPRAYIANGTGADILEGRSQVIDEHGTDITGKFVKGAEEVLKIAELTGAKEAFLKEKSPSCGINLICREGDCVPGMGVAAAILSKAGLKLKSF